MSTVHFTSSVRTFEICQCGLVHVLRNEPEPKQLRVLSDPVMPSPLIAMIDENDPPSGAFFDYERQAWVDEGKYVRCAHPESMHCSCYGKLHEGEPALPAKTIWNSDGTDGPVLICPPPPVSDS